MVEFVSRAEWGARPPKSVAKRDPKTLSGVVLHHFGSPRAAKTHEGCAALLRGIQADHMRPGGRLSPSGGADIGYSHAVCPHSHAFTLRGFGVQAGANGDARSNREYAAVVYMAGTGDKPTKEALAVLAEVIRMWQEQGAGPLVKPHKFFTGSECPGSDLLKWLETEPAPWTVGGGGVVVDDVETPEEDETPPWLIDFVFWRLADDADPKKRPKGVPKRVPQSAWEAAARMDRMANLVGPQESFLDWAEWRRRGSKKDERPRSAPTKIPRTWWDALERLQQIFPGAKKPAARKIPKEPKPKPEPEPEPKEEPVEPAAGPVTAETGLLRAPGATQKALADRILARDHGGYGAGEVREIVKKYVATSKEVGLDPLLVVTQMVLETGNLTSFWSQPPRRNPAGIGVTGEPGKGLSFSSWDKAVRAHVGRLLAYAIPEGEETPAQRKLIKEALAVRPLPSNRRGCAPTLKGLAGTWATDKQYAKKLVR
ncbi:MAG TPA: glucosaminidase domain-containing protein, partial [Gaiellaceae bacterium]|nr:glucosaminidase domain-containing protein [Gaiellaceae bacterium]